MITRAIFVLATFVFRVHADDSLEGPLIHDAGSLRSRSLPGLLPVNFDRYEMVSSLSSGNFDVDSEPLGLMGGEARQQEVLTASEPLGLRGEKARRLEALTARNVNRHKDCDKWALAGECGKVNDKKMVFGCTFIPNAL